MTGRLAAVGLLLRNLLWAILLPGVQAGYLPWRFFGLREARPVLDNPVDLLGLLAMGAGVLLLGACILEFARGARCLLSIPPSSSWFRDSIGSFVIRCIWV